LIISSAGMGTTLAVSAAIMLIIFHAISKALLFLCTGQIEHIIGSRDIEDMAGLIRKAPIVTILTAFGMLSMIVPPFGVLITKWISIEAAAKNPFVTIFLVLGSALTSVYYIKWLGTILAHPVIDIKPKYKLDITTYFPLGALGIGILVTSIFITPIFNKFVSPEVIELLRAQNQLIGKNGKVYSQIGSFNDAIVFLVLITTFILFLIVRKLILVPKIKNVYMCGENVPVEDKRLRFRDGMGNVDKAVVGNIYFTKIIDEERFTKLGYAISIIMLLTALIGGLI
jgi:ech hydrogenase subunit A